MQCSPFFPISIFSPKSSFFPQRPLPLSFTWGVGLPGSLVILRSGSISAVERLRKRSQQDIINQSYSSDCSVSPFYIVFYTILPIQYFPTIAFWLLTLSQYFLCSWKLVSGINTLYAHMVPLKVFETNLATPEKGLKSVNSKILIF